MSSAHVNGVVDQPSSGNGASPPETQEHPVPSAGPAARPEVAMGAAFVGGFLLALFLRRVRS
jgi:hypothetical protein